MNKVEIWLSTLQGTPTPIQTPRNRSLRLCPNLVILANTGIQFFILFDSLAAGVKFRVAAVKRLPVLYYSVDYIFISSESLRLFWLLENRTPLKPVHGGGGGGEWSIYSVKNYNTDYTASQTTKQT